MSGAIDIGDEVNDLPELEGDGQRSSDNMASSDGQGEPEGSQPQHYDIVPQSSDGDLILEWIHFRYVVFSACYTINPNQIWSSI